MYDIAIVGGGASGVMAALASQKTQPLRVIVIEQLQRIGSKIRATGNGKCNLTNVNVNTALYGRNKKLIATVSNNFTSTDTIQFFHEIGLQCTTHSSGRVYPYSMQASSVLDILHNALNKYGVVVKNNTTITQIEKFNNHFKLHPAKGETIFSKKVILSTGGKVMPSLGSTGSGYILAQQMGHTITNMFPALVKLKTDEKRIKGLAGIRVSASVSVTIDKKLVGQENGEVQFTQYGLSGIPIMQLSRWWGEKKKAAPMFILLDFMPDYTSNQLFDLLTERKDSGLFETLDEFLVGIINKKIGYAVMSKANLNPLSRKVTTIANKELQAITEYLKSYPIHIIGSMPWNEAQITAGGVDTVEFAEETLESSITPGLYASGELLDVYGECGGYNLQWAWASGFACGSCAAKTCSGE